MAYALHTDRTQHLRFDALSQQVGHHPKADSLLQQDMIQRHRFQADHPNWHRQLTREEYFLQRRVSSDRKARLQLGYDRNKS